MKFPFYHQHDIADCGVACLKMIAKFYGMEYSMEYLRGETYISREGVSLLNISKTANKLGFQTDACKCTLENLINTNAFPCILHWNQTHFVVLYAVETSKSLFSKKEALIFYIADPAHGKIKVDGDTFIKAWQPQNRTKGFVLRLVYVNNKQQQPANSLSNKSGDYAFILNYLKPHKKYMYQLILGMLGTSLITLIFPFLTQILVDNGVTAKDTRVIYLVLFSQLFIYVGNCAIEILQNWLLLHINVRISLSIVSDFLKKLLKLPISFFDSKAVGDITQRINDHYRIENFLSSSILSVLFSVINIVVFTIVLALYNLFIAVIFTFFNLLAFIWVIRFQKRRKILDYKRFQESRNIQDNLFEMILGMQEIKLYGSENSKRWEWENLQVKLFKLNISSLRLEHFQRIGFFFVSQIKNILISFIAAMAVVSGEFSIGVMLSVSYILGQTNSPVEQIIAFIKSAQDAKLSMDRMKEIHDKKNEFNERECIEAAKQSDKDRNIYLRNVSFHYEGPNSPHVLRDIFLTIPNGKVTAIVGASGGGKTTLIKLLLTFYAPANGSIMVGNKDLNLISPDNWRAQCGTVMQDGYLFSDSIERNIALDGMDIDYQKMENAIQIANLNTFIHTLPLGYQTKIGNNGIGLSGGQKQRILIARAVYKNPDYLFFDEATSSLDANNEKIIMENLQRFFKGKTVLIIAHRLSTVKNADQIVVINEGVISEIGSHIRLLENRAYYYQLVRNQLEMENEHEKI